MLQLAAGLDALDDYVRSRMRQAVAELRTRQEQIEASLDRPGDLSEQPKPEPTPSRETPAAETFLPLNDEESDIADEARYLEQLSVDPVGPSNRSDRRGGGEDDGHPTAGWCGDRRCGRCHLGGRPAGQLRS